MDLMPAPRYFCVGQLRYLQSHYHSSIRGFQMFVNNLVYDVSLLAGVILCGSALSLGAYNLFDAAYWYYIDWREEGKD